MIFLGLGAVVMLCGIAGLFTLEEPQIKGEKTNSNYWSDLFYGFRPSVIKTNKSLYNDDMALTGVTVEEVEDSFFDDKDDEFSIILLIFYNHLLT